MKKGFTLVELLIVIALIGLLIAIAVPSGIAISNKIKEKMLDTKIKTIEQGSIVWGQNNKEQILPLTSSNCSEEIKNTPDVTECIKISLSKLLEENALEEDKVDESGNKILINPVTNTSLIDCGIEIYIKNKRVYAKYNPTGENCGYEKEDDENEDEEIPKIILINNDILHNTWELPSTSSNGGVGDDCIQLSEDIRSGKMIQKVNVLDYYGSSHYLYDGNEYDFDVWEEPGFYLETSNENKINTEIGDWIISVDPIPNIGWKITYAINKEGPTNIENKGKIESVFREVTLVDKFSPKIFGEGMSEYNDTFFEYDNEERKFYGEYLNETGGYRHLYDNYSTKFYVCDNYDGKINFPSINLIGEYDKTTNVKLCDSFSNCSDEIIKFKRCSFVDDWDTYEDCRYVPVEDCTTEEVCSSFSACRDFNDCYTEWTCEYVPSCYVREEYVCDYYQVYNGQVRVCQ